MADKIPHFDQDFIWCDNCKDYKLFQPINQRPFVAVCTGCDHMYRTACFELVEKEHPAINQS